MEIMPKGDPPDCSRQVKPLPKKKWLALQVVTCSGDTPGMLAVMLVASMPAPIRLTFLFTTVTAAVHVQLPAGTTTRAPLCAELMAACTADCEQFAAWTSTGP